MLANCTSPPPPPRRTTSRCRALRRSRAWRPSRTGSARPRPRPGLVLDRRRRSPSRSRSPASGVTVRCGVTLALPPPCTTAVAALGPITATRCSAPGSRGRTARARDVGRCGAGPWTRPRSPGPAAHRSGSSTEVSGGSTRAAPTRSRSRSSRRACSATTWRGTSPASTAAASGGPEVLRRAPASRGRARRGPPRTVAWVANQSDMTSPSKPHSSLQHRRQQPRVLAAEGAVDAVVRRHHRPDAAIAHGGLERAQVDLAQRPLVDVAADRVPLDLGVVGHEVLDAGRDAPALHAAHEGDREASGQRRVLAVGLEVPASERVADQVDASDRAARGPPWCGPRRRWPRPPARPGRDRTWRRAPSRTGTGPTWSSCSSRPAPRPGRRSPSGAARRAPAGPGECQSSSPAVRAACSSRARWSARSS